MQLRNGFSGILLELRRLLILLRRMAILLRRILNIRRLLILLRRIAIILRGIAILLRRILNFLRVLNLALLHLLPYTRSHLRILFYFASSPDGMNAVISSPS
jgi:hypothetical protein